MPDNDHKRATDEIRQLVKSINQTWLKGRPEELKAYFHPDIQFVNQNIETMGSGRRVCIESYQDFLKQAVILKYQESDPQVQVWGNSALARYTFQIEYEMAGKMFADSGVDLFLFTNQESRWLAVWRLMLTN